jgi:hypothetical protein
VLTVRQSRYHEGRASHEIRRICGIIPLELRVDGPVSTPFWLAAFEL